jgi:hypothetical protein
MSALDQKPTFALPKGMSTMAMRSRWLLSTRLRLITAHRRIGQHGLYAIIAIPID